MKKTAYLVGLLVMVIVMLSVIQVTLTNQISTHGIVLTKVEEDLNKYKKENALLKEEILEKSSFTKLNEQAKSLGFASSKSEVYLSTPLPMARR